jgi:hypothetical protein
VVRAQLILPGRRPVTVGSAGGTADRHGALTLRLPAVARRTVEAHATSPRAAVILEVVVTATRSNQSTRQTVSFAITR